MPTKQKDTAKKVIKKKVTSITSKTKGTLAAKKTVKKTVRVTAKKMTKTKSLSKKTEAKTGSKGAKTKVLKSASSVKKPVKKTIHQEKKTAKKNVVDKVIEKKEAKAVEGISKSKRSAKIHEPVAVKQDVVVEQKKQNAAVPASNEDKIEEKQEAHKEPVLVEVEESKPAMEIQEEKPSVRETESKAVILINELITVRELADKMRLMAGDVLKKLLSLGSLATINQRLDTDTAALLANEFGYDVKMESIYSEEKIGSSQQDDDPSKLKARHPVVTIMGHVDHGKTTLLDVIRNSDIAGGEHGGITQHIGAYKVKAGDGYIAFLDTPGHEAFTAMRSRGSQATDIVVLVVSATDGVMPQTVESINHAKAASVPIIVAVNKIDMPTADPQKIRQELSNYGLVAEEWGGDTIMVDISAKQKTNIDSLLEMILLKAEMMELKVNPDNPAKGIVIEARLDPKKGTVATLLVQSGTLKVGDNIVVGITYGKIRALSDEHKERHRFAGPSTPISVLGINEPPQVGDKFFVVEYESKAREIAQSRKEKVKEASLKPAHHLSLADISAGKEKDLRIILKADVQGSLGALCDALERLSTHEISLKIIHRGAGSITESDVSLAVASNALIVSFNLRPDSAVERLAEKEKVSINVYRIIYDLIGDIKAAMEGLLDPDIKETILGKAVVKQVFRLSSFGTISGSSVTDGKIQRGDKVRLLRDNAIIFEGNISSLKRFKDDVKEVEKGYECGIGLENFADVKPSDIIESFVIDKIARKLDS